MDPTKLNATLFLDLATIETAPQYFATLALMLRAAGARIHVVEQYSDRHEVGHRAAKFLIPFSQAVFYRSEDNCRTWKLNYVRDQLLPQGPVIWPDVDFTGWEKSDGDAAAPGLTIFNWEKMRREGLPGGLKEWH